MKFFREFKEFAFKGNVIDMAVGVIIGGAFGKIVTSLVNDIIMPPLGALLGGIDFAEMKWVIVEAVGENAAVTLNYGSFIQNVVDFLIIAFCIFLFVRGISAARRKKQAELPKEPPKPSNEELLLTEIRDLLKENSQDKAAK